MTWYEVLSFTVSGALFTLTSFGIGFSFFSPSLDKWHRRYLAILFSIQLVCVTLAFIDAIIFFLSPTLFVLDHVINFIVFFLMLPLVSMAAVFLSHSCGEDWRKSPLIRTVIGLSVVYLAMLITAEFTDIFYQHKDEELFVRGPLFPLLVAPLVAITLLTFVGVIVKRKKLPREYYSAFLAFLPPLTVALFVHMFVFFELFLFLAVGLWAIVILTLVVKKNTNEHLRQQKEIMNQHASILMLQMRPHFIYNTMTSIYYLCDQDPAKAKQVTVDFTTYLRKNFTAIASDTLIPFADELEHTRAYLSVEQAQFEDSLFVIFDTPHTLFRLPPLTLQPIVENAVKHGMRETNAPIHISVTTRKTDTANEIIVEDDGPGLMPSDNNEPHIALENIRQRLEMMCKGTLSFSPREEGGTIVKVTIPLA